MTNSWSCLLDSVGLLLDMPVSELVEKIGHDGSEVINPDLKDPACRKGFHIQEIIDCLESLGYGAMPIEARPVQIISESDSNHYEVPISDNRFKDYLDKYNGIIVGRNPSGFYHAVAWKDNKILDPTGRDYNLKDCYFDIKIFWAIFKISISVF